MPGRRPEHTAPPEIYYGIDEATKYTNNSRIIEVQSEMAERVYELLALDDDQPHLLLDIGCGSGLSGECLTENGHHWVGLDISNAMLHVAREREVEGDLLEADMGAGLPFKAASFDGAVSVSALQWLCNRDKAHHSPQRRLHTFFSSLYACMTRGARAVFQVYPENDKQMSLMTEQACRAGFDPNSGWVIDFPNSTKAKKFYLVLMAGGGASVNLPQPLQDEFSVQNAPRQRLATMRGKSVKKSRDWIMEKKERRRRQGRDVRPDTKYTGRKRRTKF